MVRILLVDEQKVIREGLRVLLESESDIEIVAAVSNGYAAIAKIDETNPDILFISMKLSKIEGLDVIAIIRKKYPLVKIIIFSDKVTEQHLVQSLEMGIRGYLLKNTPVKEIVEAIYLVEKGYTHIANGAYDTVIPQISQTLSQINTPKPEIVFTDTAEYRELPQWETDTNPEVSPSSTTLANYKVEPPNKINPPDLTTDSSPESPPLLMMEATRVEASSSASLPSNQEEKKNGLNRYFSIISLASFGLLAISIGVISVISRRPPQLTIEDAIINGKTVTVDSPIRGKIAKINYPKGTSVNVDSVIATLEPVIGDRYERETDYLQEQIKLKQQQQTVAQQSLSFLESSLQNLEQELNTGNPTDLNSLLKSIHLNQIKYQEIALKTARIREDAARNNYEELVKLERRNRVSPAQVNSAKNSWELAQLAIEEITTKLASTRQEYELIQQQIAGSQKQQDYSSSRKIARLKQQIISQKTTLKLLQTEISNLDSKLIVAVSEAVQNKSLPLKSPIAGTVYHQKYAEGEVVDASEPIATIIDCSNLWIEATIEPQAIGQIDTQESVLVTIDEANLSLEGKVSIIESLNGESLNASNPTQQVAITTQIPPHLTDSNYSRVIVTVPFIGDRLSQQDFCSVGQTARLSFGEGKASLLSQWQPKWLSHLMSTY